MSAYKTALKITFLYISLISFFLISCSGPPPDLKLSGGDAFGFDLGDSWEVNASVKAEGFMQKEIEDEYSLHISYSVDLLTPEKDTLKAVYSDSINEIDSEEFMDVILEAQLEVDNEFGDGIYQIIFNVNDEYSKQSKSIAVDFNLGK